MSESHEGQKYCSAHEEWHAIEEFGIRRASADGLQAICKEAMRSKVNKSRHENNNADGRAYNRAKGRAFRKLAAQHRDDYVALLESELEKERGEKPTKLRGGVRLPDEDYIFADKAATLEAMLAKVS